MSSCFYTSSALAYNSSSYLISKLAINLFDFEEAYKHYTNIENDKNESYLHNKLLTYINLITLFHKLYFFYEKNIFY